jgi:hypothetical protein
VSARNTRAAKAARRQERERRRASAEREGLGRFALGLSPAVVAELDAMGERGELPEGFTLAEGGHSGELPPEFMKLARAALPGGWEPGWSWRCGEPGCPGGHAIGSPELIAAIGVCTGS